MVNLLLHDGDRYHCGEAVRQYLPGFHFILPISTMKLIGMNLGDRSSPDFPIVGRNTYCIDNGPVAFEICGGFIRDRMPLPAGHSGEIELLIESATPGQIDCASTTVVKMHVPLQRIGHSRVAIEHIHSAPNGAAFWGYCYTVAPMIEKQIRIEGRFIPQDFSEKEIVTRPLRVAADGGARVLEDTTRLAFDDDFAWKRGDVTPRYEGGRCSGPDCSSMGRSSISRASIATGATGFLLSPCPPQCRPG